VPEVGVDLGVAVDPGGGVEPGLRVAVGLVPGVLFATGVDDGTSPTPETTRSGVCWWQVPAQQILTV